MKKTKMFMLVLTSAVLALTPVTANAAEAAPSHQKSHRKKAG